MPQLDFKVIASLPNSKNLKKQLEANQLREGRELRLARYEESPEVLEWAADNAQLCPFCYTLVEKKAGCNHMTCSCKKEFFYCCGIPYRDREAVHHEVQHNLRLSRESCTTCTTAGGR